MEIVEGIHQVEGIIGNVFIVGDQDGLTIVDTGMPRNAEKILDYIRKMNHKPSDVSTIVLTHCHVDHVGSAHDLKELTKAKVAVHEMDADFVAGKKVLPVHKGVAGLAVRAFSGLMKPKPVQPDTALKENDRVGELVVVHTPGHTPGSISLLFPAKRALFVGDAIRVEDDKIAGPSEQYSFNIKLAMESVEKIAQLDFDVLLSGHGSPLRPDASSRVREFLVSVEQKRKYDEIT
ncbi:MAG TPA: MBL fold metallo-hydrolase [Candidatus Bathyarchaeia archaeon]|nr:MAG: hypothetical protein A3K70_00105 [Candidatus Bathyarchaeota archaeon RBG_16_48_13]HJX24082.1 MBL fold metallo-hydrolase [Candidatus Bathyarchaeia archaeon]